MAIIIRGKSPCALCDDVLGAGDGIVATSAFIEDVSHRLWRFSDAGMHDHCFMKWTDREEFIATFNSYWDAHHRGMRHMLADGTTEEREPRAGGTV